MRYYIIAGELSGDEHGAYLCRYLHLHDNEFVARGFGGDNMQKEGVEIVKHINELAFMGFVEVATHLPKVLHNLSFCKKDIQDFKPDCVILVDYPGFNLRIAKFLHKLGIKVFYYISPTVWAWRKGRIKQIKKYVNKLYVILPFEKNFYNKYDIEVEYYGNPLLDEINDFSKNQENKEKFLSDNNLGSKPIIALLAGSRKQEISKMLPLQSELANKYADKFDFVVAGISSIGENYYKKYLHSSKVRIIYDKTYDILNVAYAGVINNGTATLQAALFNLPLLSCYQTAPITYMIAKYLIKIKYISLINLILNRQSIRELIQKDWNRKELDKEFRKIAFDDAYRHNIRADYDRLKNLLGNAGASNQIALSIINHLKK